MTKDNLYKYLIEKGGPRHLTTYAPFIDLAARWMYRDALQALKGVTGMLTGIMDEQAINNRVDIFLQKLEESSKAPTVDEDGL